MALNNVDQPQKTLQVGGADRVVDHPTPILLLRRSAERDQREFPYLYAATLGANWC